HWENFKIDFSSCLCGFVVQKNTQPQIIMLVAVFFYFLLASLSFFRKTSKSIFLRVFVALWFKKNAQPRTPNKTTT
ncbi:hypothetical protein CEN46_06525, partial [Fischerella thermalis CCMEE 5318]